MKPNDAGYIIDINTYYLNIMKNNQKLKIVNLMNHHPDNIFKVTVNNITNIQDIDIFIQQLETYITSNSLKYATIWTKILDSLSKFIHNKESIPPSIEIADGGKSINDLEKEEQKVKKEEKEADKRD